MTRTKTLNVKLEVAKDQKTKNGFIFVQRSSVEGTMAMIVDMFKKEGGEHTKEILDEYAGMYILKQLGIKIYPLTK